MLQNDATRRGITEMIYKIDSQVEPGKTIHMVCKPNEIEDKRTDVVSPSEYMQLSVLNLEAGKTFPPHKHIYKQVPNEAIAQESWVVIRGKVEVFFYDLDDSFLESVVLDQGDVSITLYGGHTYKILEDETLVLEYKTGPYYGQKLDKEFLKQNG